MIWDVIFKFANAEVREQIAEELKSIMLPQNNWLPQSLQAQLRLELSKVHMSLG